MGDLRQNYWEKKGGEKTQLGEEECFLHQTLISTIPNVLSYQLWLLYMTPQFFDENSNKLSGDGDANGFSQIGIKIKTRGPGLEILKKMRILYDIQERHRRY